MSEMSELSMLWLVRSSNCCIVSSRSSFSDDGLLAFVLLRRRERVPHRRGARRAGVVRARRPVVRVGPVSVRGVRLVLFFHADTASQRAEAAGDAEVLEYRSAVHCHG